MKPATILIIEDHDTVRTLLAWVLKDALYQACEAAASLPAFGGMQLRVHLSVPGHSEPLRIQKAFVRWRSQDAIGLEFSRLGEPEQRLLCRVVQDLDDALPQPAHTTEPPPRIAVSLVPAPEQ